MNVLAAFGLYLLGAFTLIVLALLGILPTNYLGGFVIAGFMGGLIFAWLNAWRQGDKLDRNSSFEVSPQSGNAGSTQSIQNYPCLKQIVEGTKVGETCIYSASCEIVTDCMLSSNTIPAKS
jgi:hypothetical protein